jgi:hypothetical protein
LSKTVARKPSPEHTEMRFEVSRVYKGSAYREQVVASPLGSDGCGIHLDVNSDWVIFAQEQIEGSGKQTVFRLVSELCSGNVPGSAPPIILGTGRPPLDGASDREEKAVNADAVFTRVLLVGGIAIGVLTVAALVGLAILWRPGRTRS